MGNLSEDVVVLEPVKFSVEGKSRDELKLMLEDLEGKRKSHNKEGKTQEFREAGYSAREDLKEKKEGVRTQINKVKKAMHALLS